MIKTQVTLFGKLKKWAPQGGVEVEITKNMTPQNFRFAVSGILKELNPEFPGVSEIQSSAVADESRIYHEEEMLEESKEYSLLPPVCGG